MAKFENKNFAGNFLCLIFEILSGILWLIFAPLYFIIRTLFKKSCAGFLAKSGFFDTKGLNLKEKTVMFHGVSVGEVIALENLIRLARKTFTDYKIIVTTGTKTGQDIAQKKYAGIADFITYFPFDLPVCTKGFFNKIRPDVILMAETELWPFFAYYAKRKNIPLLLINGRISDDSFKTYKYFGWFFRHIFKCYSGIYTQSKDDSEKIIKIGAPENRVEVMKNLKFDIQKNETPVDFKKGDERIFLAGSTHTGEDEIVFNVYKALKNVCPNLKLMIAPRHLTRVNSISDLIKNKGLTFGLRSKKADFSDNDVIILDTLGELSRMYSVSDIAFIGGSFNNTGGHNPLEAVIWSKPVVSGPSVKNFKDIYALLCKSGAAKIVKNEGEFEDYLKKLLLDEEFYKKTCDECENIFNDQKGAKDFVIAKMKEILK